MRTSVAELASVDIALPRSKRIAMLPPHLQAVDVQCHRELAAIPRDRPFPLGVCMLGHATFNAKNRLLACKAAMPRMLPFDTMINMPKGVPYLETLFFVLEAIPPTICNMLL